MKLVFGYFIFLYGESKGRNMIEEYGNFFVNNPFAWLVISIICFMGCYYCFRRFTGISTARRIVRTQTNPAPQNVLDELVEEAKASGNEKYLLDTLRTIREKFGHDGVKVGHIMWILHLIETGYPDIGDMEIPSFNAEEQTVRTFKG